MSTGIWARLRRPVSAVLAASMIVSGLVFFHGEVSAATDASEYENDSNVKKQQQKIADLEKRQAAIKKEISSLKNDIDGLMQQKENYDALIEVCDSKIKATEELITELNRVEDELREDIETKKAESSELYERIKERMVIAYESGGTKATYLELIFGSESLFDFLVGIDNAVSIMEYDSKLMDDYRELTESLEDEYAKQKENLKIQEETAEMLETQREEAEALASDCEKLMEKARSDMALKQEDADKIAAQRDAADARLDDIIEELIKKNGTTQNVAEGEFRWPLDKNYKKITSYFGPRKDPFTGKPSNHGGTDIYAPRGSNIYASNSGTVVKSATDKSYGKYIIIDHGGNLFTLYAHCSQLLVSEGTYVEKGTVIAKVGMTGSATGFHLHIEFREGKKRVDALKYLTRP